MVMNTTNRDQTLPKGFSLAHCEPVTPSATIWRSRSADARNCPTVRGHTCRARPNLRNEETQELEELITKYKGVSATENSNYGWTDKRHKQICRSLPDF
jgi:hypothetical protein